MQSTGGQLRVAVTGAAGMMGARVVAGLRSRGFAVRALVLPGDPQRRRLTECEVVAVDVTVPETLADAFVGVHTVLHLAAIILARDPGQLWQVNAIGTGNVIEAAVTAGVEHFVYVSSASVTYRRSTPYSRSKREAERLVSARDDIAWTIARPTLAYDADGGVEFVMFRDHVLGFPGLVPLIGGGRAVKRPVWTGDIERGLVDMVDTPTAHGKTYNLSGPTPVSLAEMARVIQRHFGRRRPLLPVPTSVCELLSRIGPRVHPRFPLTPNVVIGLTEDADLDCSTTTRDLGYRPIDFVSGLRRAYPRED